MSATTERRRSFGITEADDIAIARAQAKRERKAAKRDRDSAYMKANYHRALLIACVKHCYGDDMWHAYCPMCDKKTRANALWLLNANTHIKNEMRKERETAQ